MNTSNKRTEPSVKVSFHSFTRRTALLGIFIFLLCATNAFATAGKDGPKVGTQPPPLVLREVLHGPNVEEITWDKLKGKVVILEFWNTRCGPCIAAIPHMNSLVEQFTNKPVVFLSITDDHPDRARAFLKEKPMKGWVVTDHLLTATATAFDVKGIPHVVLVDPTGTIVALTHPAKLKAEHIEEILSGKPSSLPPQAVYEQEVEETPVETRPKIVEVSISGPHPRPDGAYNFRGWDASHSTYTATNAYLPDAIARFFNIETYQLISPDLLPEGLFDVFVSVPQERTNRLQAVFVTALDAAFGLTLKTNQQQMEVYMMQLGPTNGPSLQLTKKGAGGQGDEDGFVLRGTMMKGIASFLGHYLGKQVIDETHSTNLWAAELRWKMSESEQLPSRLRKQLDQEIAESLFDNTSTVSPELLQAIHGKLTASDFKLLTRELAKPRTEQFKTDRSVILDAAREQLGLVLTLTNRMVKIVEVLRSKEHSGAQP